MRTMMNGNSELEQTLQYLGFDRQWLDNFNGSIQFPDKEGEVTVAGAMLAPDFHVDLHFSGVGENPLYVLERYTAHLLHYPPIEHTGDTASETRKLEKLLASVDWRLDYADLEKKYPTLLSIEDKECLQRYAAAMFNLIMLGAHDETKPLGDALRLRYIVGTPYEPRFVTPELRQRYTQSCVCYMRGEGSLTFEQSRSLLCGRPLFLRTKQEPQGFWLGLPKSGNAEGLPADGLVKGGRRFPPFDLKSQLKTLSMAVAGLENVADVVRGLERGEEVAVVSNVGKKRFPLTLQVDPQMQRISAVDKTGRAIRITTATHPIPDGTPRKKQRKRGI